MPKVDVVDASKQVVKSIDLSDAAFAAEIKEAVVHQVVTAQLNARRSGTHDVKERAEVSGSGVKPWKQKGTGRARSGSTRSPLWRGGAIIFGPTPRSYEVSVNKKMRRVALSSTLSSILAEGRLVVVDSLAQDEIKTKTAAATLAKLDARRPVLVVHTDGCENFVRSVANLPYVKTIRPEGVNVYDLLRAEVVVCTTEAVEGIEKRFA